MKTTTSKETRFACGCCGTLFSSTKPQCPKLPRGVGTCRMCIQTISVAFVKTGALPAGETLKETMDRLDNYA